MELDCPERQNCNAARGFQEHRAILPRQSRNHVTADPDPGRVEPPHGILHRREIVTAPDQLQRRIVRTLDAEFDPYLVIARKFREKIDRPGRQSVRARPDDHDRERSKRKHLAIKFPQSFHRRIGRSERLKIGDVRSRRSITVGHEPDSRLDLPGEVEMAREMTCPVPVLGAVDAARPEPVQPVRTAQREVDADPVAFPSVFLCDIIAEKMKFFH